MYSGSVSGTSLIPIRDLSAAFGVLLSRQQLEPALLPWKRDFSRLIWS